MSGGPEAAPFVARPPEPARLWLRFAPRRWPGPGEPWTDVAAAALGRPAADAEVPDPDQVGPEVDDVVYLPPARPELEERRLRLAAALAARGLPVLFQVLPGAPAPAGVVPVIDLLPGLLAAAALDGAPPLPTEIYGAAAPSGAIALWPLVAGLGDRPASWRRGCDLLRAAGVATVVGLPLDLPPADRRALAERAGEGSFDRLFHAARPAEQAFARVAAAAGLAPFAGRPAVRPPLRPARNREAAALLARAADLWLQLGRSEARGQALFRAARQAEQAPWELAALARDGQLPVLDWLDETGRSIVLDWARGARPALLTELELQYLSEPAAESAAAGLEAGE